MVEVVKPVIIFAVLCFVISLYTAMELVGLGMKSFRTTIMELASTKAKVVVKPGVFNKNIPGYTLYAQQVDPISGNMRKVIVDSDNNGNATTILAPEGKIETDNSAGELIFRLLNGKIYSTSPENISEISYEEYIIKMPLDSLFSGLDLGEIRPKEMTWTEQIGRAHV